MIFRKVLGWILIPYIIIPKILYRKLEGRCSKFIRIVLSIGLSILLLSLWMIVVPIITGKNSEGSNPTITSSALPTVKPTQTATLLPTVKPTKTSTPTPDPQTLYQNWFKKQFNFWDGSCYKLVDYVKENMNDADSFEHVKTYYIDKKDHLIVTMKYRGNNVLGAKVLNFIRAKVDYTTDTMTILQ